MTIDEVRDCAKNFTDYMKAKTIIEKMKCYSVYEKYKNDFTRTNYSNNFIYYDMIHNQIVVFEDFDEGTGSTVLLNSFMMSEYGITWAMSKEELE